MLLQKNKSCHHQVRNKTIIGLKYTINLYTVFWKNIVRNKTIIGLKSTGNVSREVSYKLEIRL